MKTLIFISILFLSACGSTGKPIEQSKVNGFIKGETSTSEVISALGNPQSTTTLSDETMQLVYMHVNTSIKASTFIPIVGSFTGGATSNVQSLIIKLDENGVVTDWQYTQTESEYNN